MKHKRGRRGPSAGPRIVAALTELTESLERGDALPAGAVAREARLPDEPGVHVSGSIRALRERLGASREDFAGMLGLSPAQVQSLEIGRREPSRLTRRMLDEFARDPERWRRLARHRTARAIAEAIATLEELRMQIAGLIEKREKFEVIEVRLNEMREAIHMVFAERRG